MRNIFLNYVGEDVWAQRPWQAAFPQAALNGETCLQLVVALWFCMPSLRSAVTLYYSLPFGVRTDLIQYPKQTCYMLV